MPCVFLAVAFEVAVSQWELQAAAWRDFSAELSDTVLDGVLDGILDLPDGGGVGLRDEDGNGVFGVAAVNGAWLPDVGVGQADFSGDNAGGHGG